MINFPSDYQSAREQFLAAAHAAGCRLSSLALEAVGPQDERLSIDIARLGVSGARKLLIHSCGLHGVEGFAGSAVQRQLLLTPPSLPDDCGLILVHILNPYGMAWLRRTNQANVDLNRNFFFGDQQRPSKAESYAKLDSLLNPATAPRRELFIFRALGYLLRYGYRNLKSTIAQGQYAFPKGLFYGGRELQWEVQLYRDWLRSQLFRPERLLVIDLHTGLGKLGEESLFQALSATPPEVLSKALTTRVTSDGINSKVLGYRTLGGHEELYRGLFPASRIDFLTHEFGTRSSLQVLQALRRENQWHHFGDGTINHPSKRALLDVFCPSDPHWRRRIVERGVRMIRKGLEFLASGTA